MLEGYPKQVVVRNGTKAILRPMVKEDLEKLREFFKDMTEQELRYLRDDVTDPRVIEEWVDNLNYERVLPILAEVDGRIVANATLHRRRHSLSKHIGKLRIFVGPEYRRVGLGTWMLLDLMNLAISLGLNKLEAAFIAELESLAIGSAERLGFHRAAVVPNYYRDSDGKEYDQVIMMKSLFQDWGEY